MTRESENLSGAYALDAVTDGERAAYEADVAGDRDAVEEVAGFTAAAAQLSHLSATAPPPALRDAVLADIRRVRPLPPQVVQLDRRRRWRRAAISLVAAAAVLIAVLLINPWRQPGAPGGPGEPSQTRSVSAYEAVAAAPDAARYPVPMKGAVATVVLSRSMGKAVLLVNAMPAIPGTKDYQAWLQLPGRGMVSAGLMPHDPTATTWDLVGDASKATAFGITVEPAGGSAAPTTAPVALVELPMA